MLNIDGVTSGVLEMHSLSSQNAIISELANKSYLILINQVYVSILNGILYLCMMD